MKPKKAEVMPISPGAHPVHYNLGEKIGIYNVPQESTDYAWILPYYQLRQEFEAMRRRTLWFQLGRLWSWMKTLAKRWARLGGRDAS